MTLEGLASRTEGIGQQHKLLVDREAMQPIQRIARLTSLDVALTRIDALVRPVAGREVALAAAVGRVLAGDVVVAARPRVALALRDGWAVNAALTQDAGPYAPAPLPSAVLIEAGVPLPAGADAVAEIDAVVLREGRAEAVAAITGGEGVLAAGADADGATAFGRDGRRLHAVAAAALAAVGMPRVDVREPRVLVHSGEAGSRPDHRRRGGLGGARDRGRGRAHAQR